MFKNMISQKKLSSNMYYVFIACSWAYVSYHNGIQSGIPLGILLFVSGLFLARATLAVYCIFKFNILKKTEK